MVHNVSAMANNTAYQPGKIAQVAQRVMEANSSKNKYQYTPAALIEKRLTETNPDPNSRLNNFLRTNTRYNPILNPYAEDMVMEDMTDNFRKLVFKR